MGRVPVVDLDIISFGRGYYSQLIKQKVDMIQVCKIKTCEIQVCGITMTISTDYRVDSTDYHPIQRSHKKKTLPRSSIGSLGHVGPQFPNTVHPEKPGMIRDLGEIRSRTAVFFVGR